MTSAFIVLFAILAPCISIELVQINSIAITDAQIQDVATELWYSDNSRVVPTLDFQQKASRNDKIDLSPDKFFQKFNDSILSAPTVKALQNLFDLYDKYGSNEEDTVELDRLGKQFLNELSKTNEYRILKVKLARLEFSPANTNQEFQDALFNLWFTRFRRQKTSSSAFKHVFVGEISKKQIVSGLHNWIRWYDLEKKGDINYAGYFEKRQSIASVQYTWGRTWKTEGSMFVGTSPEFDFSIFTFCALIKQKCNFLLGDCTSVYIQKFSFIRNKRTYLSTVYPIPKKVVKNCKLMRQSPKDDFAEFPSKNDTIEVATLINHSSTSTWNNLCMLMLLVTRFFL